MAIRATPSGANHSHVEHISFFMLPHRLKAARRSTGHSRKTPGILPGIDEAKGLIRRIASWADIFTLWLIIIFRVK
jgi:hypothetical protein